jgi:hypothetical protein
MYDLISIPYILISLLSFVILRIRKDKRFFYSNNFLIGVTTLLIVFCGTVNLFYTLFQAWYSGYLYEFYAFQIRMHESLFYAKSGLIIFVVILSFLNLRSSFRKNFKIQILLLILFVGIALINYLFSILSTVTPGWHTTIGVDSNFFNFLNIFTLGVTLNLVIVNFKLIPELREE